MATESSGNRDHPRTAGYKIRGHIAYSLVRDLAEGTLSQRRLATKYDVHLSTIADFKSRNRERIEAVKADLDNEFAGMWIAEKRKRIAAYMDDVELLDDSLEATTAAREVLSIEGEDGTGLTIAKLDRDMAAILKRKHSALRSVAEELGHLPNRMTLNVQGGESPVLHQVVGVDIDDV